MNRAMAAKAAASPKTKAGAGDAAPPTIGAYNGFSSAAAGAIGAGAAGASSSQTAPQGPYVAGRSWYQETDDETRELMAESDIGWPTDENEQENNLATQVDRVNNPALEEGMAPLFLVRSAAGPWPWSHVLARPKSAKSTSRSPTSLARDACSA